MRYVLLMPYLFTARLLVVIFCSGRSPPAEGASTNSNEPSTANSATTSSPATTTPDVPLQPYSKMRAPPPPFHIVASGQAAQFAQQTAAAAASLPVPSYNMGPNPATLASNRDKCTGPLLSYKEFLLSLSDDISPAESLQKYQKYKETYSKKHMKSFFELHKTEDWFFRTL